MLTPEGVRIDKWDSANAVSLLPYLDMITNTTPDTEDNGCVDKNKEKKEAKTNDETSVANKNENIECMTARSDADSNDEYY